jgi:hypothetical protein
MDTQIRVGWRFLKPTFLSLQNGVNRLINNKKGEVPVLN